MNCLPQLITKLPIAIVKEIRTIVAINGETAFFFFFLILLLCKLDRDIKDIKEKTQTIYKF